MNFLVESESESGRIHLLMFEEGYDPFVPQVLTLLKFLKFSPLGWGHGLIHGPLGLSGMSHERLSHYLLTLVSEEVFVGLGEAFSRFIISGLASDDSARDSYYLLERFKKVWGPL